MRKKWFRQILRRRILVILLLLLQGVVLFELITNTSQLIRWVNMLLSAASFLAALKIVSSRDKPTYKLLWVFLILSFPVFGGIFYLLVYLQTSPRFINKKLPKIEEESRIALNDNGEGYKQAYQMASDYAVQLRYLQKQGFQVYEHTYCDYLSPGEKVFAALIPELKAAENYIFLEFFIIQEGIMWDTIHDILKEKASQGILVRVLYDDIGSFLTLPKDYAKQLEGEGIQCSVFNPFRPILSSLQNNRDHRKIISIDGKVAFTGGFNLADEYINAIEKHGYWKDAGLMLRGEAAWSLTVMFLQMWSLSNHMQEDFLKYFPWGNAGCPENSDGFVLPYSDKPLDRENIGEHVYLQIINRAKNYVYINTPYLIIDDSMVSALSLAAKSGVDIRIITPHHWDKWIVHMTTRTYYPALLEAGVKIYEYTPGFIHAKTFVSDDRIATVGTINLDYRSLYLHFECGVWMWGNRVINQVKDDFLGTLNECQEITMESCRHGVIFRVFQEILRLLAPLF